MGVLGQAAVTGVVDAHDNQRFHFAGFDGLVGVLTNLPCAAGNEGSAGVEEVLTVVQVENRIGERRVLVIAGRHVDDKVALVGKEMAGEGAMKMEPRMRCDFGKQFGLSGRVQQFRRIVF